MPIRLMLRLTNPSRDIKLSFVRLKVSLRKRLVNVLSLLRKLDWLTDVLVLFKVSLKKPELFSTLLTVARSKLIWN